MWNIENKMHRLRQAVEISWHSRRNEGHPFGTLLVDAPGAVHIYRPSMP